MVHLVFLDLAFWDRFVAWAVARVKCFGDLTCRPLGSGAQVRRDESVEMVVDVKFAAAVVAHRTERHVRPLDLRLSGESAQESPDVHPKPTPQRLLASLEHEGDAVLGREDPVERSLETRRPTSETFGDLVGEAPLPAREVDRGVADLAENGRRAGQTPPLGGASHGPHVRRGGGVVSVWAG